MSQTLDERIALLMSLKPGHVLLAEEEKYETFLLITKATKLDEHILLRVHQVQKDSLGRWVPLPSSNGGMCVTFKYIPETKNTKLTIVDKVCIDETP